MHLRTFILVHGWTYKLMCLYADSLECQQGSVWGTQLSPFEEWTKTIWRVKGERDIVYIVQENTENWDEEVYTILLTTPECHIFFPAVCTLMEVAVMGTIGTGTDR
jgi:hypothetical protein